MTTAGMEEKEKEESKVKGSIISKDKGNESGATNQGNDGEVGEGEKGDDSGMSRRSNRDNKKVGGI